MIAEPKIWAAIIGLGLTTFAIRFSFLGLLAGREVAPWVRRALSFVPAAVLPALAAPMILVAETGGADPARVFACIAALVAGVASGQMMAGLGAGILGYIAAAGLLSSLG